MSIWRLYNDKVEKETAGTLNSESELDFCLEFPGIPVRAKICGYSR